MHTLCGTSPLRGTEGDLLIRYTTVYIALAQYDFGNFACDTTCSSLSPWSPYLSSLQARSTQGYLVLYIQFEYLGPCSILRTSLYICHRCRFGQPSTSDPTLFPPLPGIPWRTTVIDPSTLVRNPTTFDCSRQWMSRSIVHLNVMEDPRSTHLCVLVPMQLLFSLVVLSGMFIGFLRYDYSSNDIYYEYALMCCTNNIKNWISQLLWPRKPTLCIYLFLSCSCTLLLAVSPIVCHYNFLFFKFHEFFWFLGIQQWDFKPFLVFSHGYVSRLWWRYGPFTIYFI